MTRTATTRTLRLITAATLPLAVAGLAHVSPPRAEPAAAASTLTSFHTSRDAPVLEQLETQRARLDTAAAVTLTDAGTVSTAALTALAEAHAAAVATAEQPLPRERAARPGLLPITGAGELPVDVAAEVTAAADSIVASLESARKAFDAELAAEKERIRVAEEQERARAAAAAAAAQSAARASSYRHASGPVSAAVPGEGIHARVARLAAQLPFNVPYSFGSCAMSPKACYMVGQGIVVNAGGMASERDCRVVYTLAHEYKHLLQYNAGQIQFSGGAISNRDWLESDAMVFGYGYGCRP